MHLFIEGWTFNALRLCYYVMHTLVKDAPRASLMSFLIACRHPLVAEVRVWCGSAAAEEAERDAVPGASRRRPPQDADAGAHAVGTTAGPRHDALRILAHGRRGKIHKLLRRRRTAAKRPRRQPPRRMLAYRNSCRRRLLRTIRAAVHERRKDQHRPRLPPRTRTTGADFQLRKRTSFKEPCLTSTNVAGERSDGFSGHVDALRFRREDCEAAAGLERRTPQVTERC